ncbi:nuclear transport factor 2 family protein [Sphingomonas flavalba]|uniref:nuclear transport factor 2 family protein n=1 Tax=Sphingomonas flavalba TaxID=2559804 RepID=UPI00109DB089|nr:nuclear transport factor 2 family protein [Sphingomonas flavalba]
MTSKLPKAGIVAALVLLSGVGAQQALTAGKPADSATVVRELYAAFERGDMVALEQLIAPDATWTYYGPPDKLPFGGTRHGPKGVAEFFATVDETLENPVAVQRAFIVSGDMVAVPGTEESTVRKTGIRYKADLVHVFKVRDGKIVSFEEFIDSGKVLLAFQGDGSAGIGGARAASAPAAGGARRPVDRSAGKAAFTTCLGCHGNDGQGRAYMHAPDLTGLDAEYLARQLTNYRTGKRGKLDDAHGFQMVGRATAIPGPDGVKAVVSYITALPKPQAAPVANRPVPAAIRAIVPTCAACHGAAGEGNAALQAPALDRLDADYIARQLVNFRTGKRGYHADDVAGATMAASAQTIPDRKAIDALAAYYGK